MTISSMEAERLLRIAGFGLERQTSTHKHFERDGTRIFISVGRSDIPKAVEAKILKFIQGKKDSRTQGREAIQNKVFLVSNGVVEVGSKVSTLGGTREGEVIDIERELARVKWSGMPSYSSLMPPAQLKLACDMPAATFSPEAVAKEELVEEAPAQERKGLLGQLEEFQLAAMVEHEELNRMVSDISRRINEYRKVQGVCKEFGIELPELKPDWSPLFAVNGTEHNTDPHVEAVAIARPAKRGKASPTGEEIRVRIRKQLDEMFDANNNTITRTQVGQRFGGKYSGIANELLLSDPNVNLRRTASDSGYPMKVWVRKGNTSRWD